MPASPFADDLGALGAAGEPHSHEDCRALEAIADHCRRLLAAGSTDDDATPRPVARVG